MSAAHTPGPWRAGKDGSPEHQNERNFVEGADGTLIVYGQANDVDAHLIAAAPTMLAALIVAREFVSSERNAFAGTCTSFDGSLEPDDAAELSDIDAALVQIDAAIHAATGSAA